MERFLKFFSVIRTTRLVEQVFGYCLPACLPMVIHK